MIQYLKQYAATHLFYLVAIGIALIAFRSWREEHDARLLAGQQIKVSDAAVKASQQQISTLQQQISATDAKSSQQLVALQKLVSTVKTPQQVAAQIPQLEPNLPAPVSVGRDDSMSFPKEDVMPLFADLAEAKTCAVKLAQCQGDYSAEQQIVMQKDAQLGEKDKEISALKKPKGFWRRMGGALKQVGVGIAIGAAIGARL